jgi:hypothetical protein
MADGKGSIKMKSGAFFYQARKGENTLKVYFMAEVG